MKSSDEETFVVVEAVAMMSQTIKHIIEDGCAGDVIPLPNVPAKVLAKILEFCNRQVEIPKTDVDDYRRNSGVDEETKKWNKEYVEVEQDMLFDIILAANYLNIKSLLDLMCQTVADMMKGKTPEEIRQKFHIKNDYTEEEEAEVRRENAWAFE